MENSTKHRADDLGVYLVCQYFCWMLGEPRFFFGRSLPFLIPSIILKNKKKSMRGKFQPRSQGLFPGFGAGPKARKKVKALGTRLGKF